MVNPHWSALNHEFRALKHDFRTLKIDSLALKIDFLALQIDFPGLQNLSSGVERRRFDYAPVGRSALRDAFKRVERNEYRQDARV